MSDKPSVPEQNEIKDDIPAMSAKDMKNIKKTEAWKVLKKRYGENVSLQKLLSVAHVMRQLMQHNLKIIIPGFSREEQRKKDCLIKWFDTHIEFIQQFLSPGMMIGYDQGYYVPISKEKAKEIAKEKAKEKAKENK